MNTPETNPGGLSAVNMQCEYLSNPIGIDIENPRLSWQISAEGRRNIQTAYQVQAAFGKTDLATGQNLSWDTGKVLSDNTIHVRYAGEGVNSGQRVYWHVRSWDKDDQPGDWSEISFFEMGLLHKEDWQAQWIEPNLVEDPDRQHPCPHMRKDFEIRGALRRARVYVTSHGLYELTLNGQTVTEDIFTPGWTAYEKRLQYQVYEANELLQEGPNTIGIILGDGWWRGKIGANSTRNAYGEKLGLLLQLHLRFIDDTEDWIISDETWKVSTGPILMSDLKDGERYDALLEMPGWNQPGYDDSNWGSVKQVFYPTTNLTASCSVPVRRHEEIQAVNVLQTPSGETVVDLGQNIAGRVRFNVEGPARTEITLTHGEVLDKDGNFTQKNLILGRETKDTWFQKVQYTLKGGGEEVYEPHFTFHGFRYIKVEGYPGEIKPENFTGIAIYSAMPETGIFHCSDEKINQLQRNIVWSQKGNFLDIPTDCPQRERAGWTGDAQIFVRTGSFNMSTAAFFTKWLQDLAAEQHSNGLVTNLVPDAFKFGQRFFSRIEGSAGWGDAAVIIPWTLYLLYADKNILEKQYDSMKAWVDYAAGRAKSTHWVRRISPSYWLSSQRRERMAYIWDTGYHWGEWLEPNTGALQLVLGAVKRMIFSEPAVAAPYLAYSSGLLAKIAGLLGKETDAAYYQEISTRAKAAYTAEFVNLDGRIKPHKQASYVRALAFELLPDELKPKAAAHLVDLVRQNGHHLGTGFLSTTFLCHMLSQYGYLDDAYALLKQQTVPSWLYAITKGATTIWETWDGVKEDGSVAMSHNHYSYGAVGSWLYQVVAGLELDPEQPGYKHFIVRPRPGGGLSHAEVEYESLHGTISAGWRSHAGSMHITVRVPVNTTATVYLPAAACAYVVENEIPIEDNPDITQIRQEGEDTVCEIGSGSYHFEITV